MDGGGHEAVTATAPMARLFYAADRGISTIIEGAAALLVVAEVLLLGSGTVARYVFSQPFAWADELASLLFIWLATLGAVIALRRGEHMRLTAFIRNVPPARRAWLDAVALALICAVLLVMILPAYDHFDDLRIGLSPVLEISEGYRGAAILVGIGLMLFTAVRNLLLLSNWPAIVSALVLVGGAVALLTWLGPVFEDMGNGNLLVFFVLFVVVAMVIGVPIAFAFMLGTVCFISFATTIPASIVPDRMDEGMSHLILLAVPLFVLLGALIEMTGLARAMVNFLAALIGHVRGGLQYVLLGAMYLVSGISGSKAADMAAVAPALFPEMKARGAKEGDLVALLSASGAMSETIPPSLVLITIGAVTGVSIAALFTGGLLPAVVGMVALGVVVYFQSRGESMQGVTKATGAQIRRALWIALPALALPFVIRTVVVEGVATATEVSTVGIAYAVLAGLFVYRQFDWKRVLPMLVETASLSGAILLIIGCATAMAWALTQSGFSKALVDLMAVVPGGKIGFMAISVIAFTILGSVLEGIPAVVLFGPLLFPVARALGIHEVHYAMVAIFAMGLGLFTPPFGVGFYAACAIGKVAPDQAIGRVWPHLGALFVALIVIAAIPWISVGFL